MSVLDEQIALFILARLPDPACCQLCDRDSTPVTRHKLPYGPFQVYMCPECAGKFSSRLAGKKVKVMVI